MCGPEVAQIINEFEESMKLETPEEDDSNLLLMKILQHTEKSFLVN